MLAQGKVAGGTPQENQVKMPGIDELAKPLGNKVKKDAGVSEQKRNRRTIAEIIKKTIRHVPGKMTETVALDTYDDVFSDFDYGPYDSRRVSADLLMELQGRLSSKPGASNVEIVFEIPGKLRQPEVEVMIKERLSQVFAEKYNSAEDEIRSERRGGFVRIGAGSLIVAGEVLANTFAPSTATTIVTGIALIPGWFGVFTGFEKLFLDLRKELVKKRDMYALLSEAKIHFKSASNNQSSES